MRTDRDGRGVVNVLAADKLMRAPRLYATFLLWMLSELFETLPEVGDLDKPKLVFFFDEAHLLFDDAPKSAAGRDRAGGAPDPFEGRRRLLRHAESARRARDVLGQLGNRVAARAARLHAARPESAVKAAAETFRQNPAFDTAQGDHPARRRRGPGVACWKAKGTPAMVERALIAPPASRVGPVTPDERADLVAASPLRGKYDQAMDRESAYEMLAKRKNLDAAPAEAAQASEGGLGGLLGGIMGSVFGSPAARAGRKAPQSLAEQVVSSAARSMARSVGTQVGNAILRNVLGGLSKR